MLPWHPLQTHKESWSVQEVKSRCFNFSAGPAMLPDLVPLLKRNDPVSAKTKELVPHLFLLSSHFLVSIKVPFLEPLDHSKPLTCLKGSGQNCGRAWRSWGKLGRDWSSCFWSTIFEGGTCNRQAADIFNVPILFWTPGFDLSDLGPPPKKKRLCLKNRKPKP